MRHSPVTARIAGEGSDAWQVHDDAIARRAAGEDIFVLSIGDPDFETPVSIREAAERALRTGRTHYAPIGGEPALLRAIAERAERHLGRDIAPEQVTVFPGAQAALFGVAQVLFGPGDEVVTADPAYVTYEAVLQGPGATMVRVPLDPDRAFRPDPAAFARAITPATRGLLVNFPHNPTGSTLDDATASALAELAVRHDLWLVSDEVYAALGFHGPTATPLRHPATAERGIWISSLSKSHAMTGWRIGWAVAPHETAHHLRQLARAMYFGVPPFVQDAAAWALTQAEPELAGIRASYRTRAEVVARTLDGVAGLRARLPEAGMYVFLDVRRTGADGKQFARTLLDAEGVSVTPGEGFGPAGAGHVRVTLGTDETRLLEACRRIARHAERLNAAGTGSR